MASVIKGIPVNIRPTLLTAVMAGVVAALAWPFLWDRWGGAAVEGGFEFIVAMLLVVVLPAHAFVVGFTRSHDASTRTLDTALLKRIGAWLASAVGVTAFRALAGM